ncbi:hypothetical protein [Marinifilum caeruleilacunae]|uniref:CarboxypepD_reg-like domain-containing protein n=1 Tax=Marinifilum caeruleilacunae TaxID=2499076 RepID=A0ABX1WZR6_9BACT|nr:hypothetical protein [Marinifilum caeruleilacunae]NOU61358.1 hypothetical protein [Marinifilum caeruleilacunae]
MPINKSRIYGKCFTCFVIVFFLFWVQNALAQTKISGKIISDKGDALENIHVLIQKQVNGGIVAFAISNAEGEYQIQFSTEKDSVYLKTQSLNYSNQNLWVSTKSHVENFTLYPDVKEIKEVNVKAPGITQRGDTLSYSVGVFASKKDQVIADVINKMPGLEVESDGRILYQGTPIRKYYIEGLDLLEGKYNLANNNLPAQAVASVQVLENHEPIKLLRNVTATDKASLNIKLKRNITLTGKAQMGTGFTPFLWNANITPMLFNKKQQFICSYQANNTGKDVASDLKVLSIEDLLDKVDNDTDKEELLGIQGLSTPNFQSMRYLDNNIHLLSNNYLLKLNKDIQLKVNSSYLNDYQKHEGGRKSEYFLGKDTVVLSEHISNSLNKRSLVNDFIVTQNSDKSYLKNTLNFKVYWDAQMGNVQQASDKIRQDYDNPFQSFSNKLKWIKPLGKRMWQFNSFVGYNRAPQSLQIQPGVYSDVLNEGKPYNAVMQEATHKVLNVNQSASLINRVKRWSFTHKLGYQYKQKDFESNIYTREQEQFENLGLDFQNRLEFNKNMVYASEGVQYISETLKLFADLPFNYSRYKICDKPANVSLKKESFLFQPQLRLNYKLNSFLEWKNSWKRIDRIKDNSRINYAQVLENYRRLQHREAALGETKGQNMGTTLFYKNPLSSVFMHIGYRYTESKMDVMLNNEIQDDGSMKIKWENYDNNSYTHNLFAQASKYVGNWKTNFSLKGNYFSSRQKMFLNQLVSPINNETYIVNSKITTDVFEWLNLEFKSEFTWLNSQINRGETNKVEQQLHKMNMMVFPWESHYFGSAAEYYKNEGAESLFLDLLYRYTFKNKRTKLELHWLNVFDKSTYSSYFVDEYSIVGNYYQLRPSQVQINLSFSF